jgi:hypothetical protein
MITESTLFKLKPCPASGEGVHTWLFHAACRFVEAGWSDEDAEPEIEALMTRDPNPQVRSWTHCDPRGERRRSTPRWSPVNPKAIIEAVKNGPRLSELVSRSPEPIQFGAQSRTELFIDTLFPGNPLLCVGKTSSQFYTNTREEFRGCLRMNSLIVPSPMSSQKGRTKRGKLSFHTESNTGPRRFLIVEFDRGTLDQQAALLWHLARFAPLALGRVQWGQVRAWLVLLPKDSQRTNCGGFSIMPFR